MLHLVGRQSKAITRFFASMFDKPGGNRRQRDQAHPRLIKPATPGFAGFIRFYSRDWKPGALTRFNSGSYAHKRFLKTQSDSMFKSDLNVFENAGAPVGRFVLAVLGESPYNKTRKNQCDSMFKLAGPPRDLRAPSSDFRVQSSSFSLLKPPSRFS